MIHPRANAVVSASGEAALRQRNQYIKSINKDSVLAWSRTSGYSRQSEVENISTDTKHCLVTSAERWEETLGR